MIMKAVGLAGKNVCTAAPGRLGLALKEPLQVRRAVDHVANMPDRLIYDRPNLLAGHTAPAFTERVIFR